MGDQIVNRFSSVDNQYNEYIFQSNLRDIDDEKCLKVLKSYRRMISIFDILENDNYDSDGDESVVSNENKVGGHKRSTTKNDLL